MESCIYCGARGVKLSNEHVIPFALGGNDEIEEASCAKCADITSRFERRVARSMYLRLRARLGVQTRRPHDRPSHFPVRVAGPGGERIVQVPALEYPRVYAVFRMPPPGILEGRVPIDTSPEGLKVDLRGETSDLDALARQGYFQPGESLVLDDLLEWNAFNRQLAKIAHAYAIKELGSGAFEHALAPIILGTSATFSHYIGGVRVEPVVRYQLALRLGEIGGEAWIVCSIFLVLSFDHRGFPTYEVVVGRANDSKTLIAHLRHSVAPCVTL